MWPLLQTIHSSDPSNPQKRQNDDSRNFFDIGKGSNKYSIHPLRDTVGKSCILHFPRRFPWCAIGSFGYAIQLKSFHTKIINVHNVTKFAFDAENLRSACCTAIRTRHTYFILILKIAIYRHTSQELIIQPAKITIVARQTSSFAVAR